MRKELGETTRELFFLRLGEVAPEFHPCSTYDVKGFTWSFLHREGPLSQWIWFQRHRTENAFTVEISWSCLSENPTHPPFGRPTDPFSPAGCRFRLGAFWEKGGDFWWHVTEPSASLFDLSPEEFSKSLLQPPVINLEKELPRIRAAIEDCVSRIHDHALPYFRQVSEWSADPLTKELGIPGR